MADCVVCAKPVSDVAYACHGCSNRLFDRLRNAAALIPDVETTVVRQARTGDPTPRAGRPAPAEAIRPDSGTMRHYADQVTGYATGLPYDQRASEAYDSIVNTITTWARVVADATGADPPRDLDDLMRWVAGRADWMRYEQWAPDAFDELAYAARLVWRIVDRPAPYVDAGICGAPTETGLCEQWLTAPQGATWIRCRVCGTTHDTTARHTEMLKAARDQRGTAMECARWLSRLGLKTTAAMVRGLAHRRRILADAHGRYRLGDVEQVRREIMDREAVA